MCKGIDGETFHAADEASEIVVVEFVVDQLLETQDFVASLETESTHLTRFERESMQRSVILAHNLSSGNEWWASGKYRTFLFQAINHPLRVP